jgi:hypothetical protein
MKLGRKGGRKGGREREGGKYFHSLHPGTGQEEKRRKEESEDRNSGGRVGGVEGGREGGRYRPLCSMREGKDSSPKMRVQEVKK